MVMKVIGAGFGRTGTLSLKNALEQLGFNKCYHMMEVHKNPAHYDIWRQIGRGEPVDWEALFEGYQASVDWPSCNFWHEQLSVWPQAKVILSQRDPEKWYASIMNTIYAASSRAAASDDPQMRANATMAFELIWDGLFDGRMDDKTHVINTYLAHNEDVKNSVPADRLLTFDPAQGWPALCDFLGVRIPDVSFPSVNSTADFQARMKAMAGD